jgi:hypothetical protein
LRSCIGRLVFVAQAIIGAATFTRRLHDWVMFTLQGVTAPVTLVVRDLRWWQKFLRRFNGKPFGFLPNRPIIKCTTDASSFAGCGILASSKAWVHSWDTKQTLWHINIKELWAVFHSLLSWGESWENSDVLLATDNSSVLSWINKGSGSSPQAMKLLRRIFWITATFNIRIRATWVPSQSNHAADAGSRWKWTSLYHLTGIHPTAITKSGLSPPFPDLPLHPPTSLTLHSQTLDLLKPTWLTWQQRTYKAHWQTQHGVLTTVPGVPSFGFAQPTIGPLSPQPKPFLSDLLHGYGGMGTLMEPSKLTSLPYQHCTNPVASSSPCPKTHFPHWQDACGALKEQPPNSDVVKTTLPLPSYGIPGDSLPKIPHTKWPSGLQLPLVSSPYYEPAAWFRSLKELGNPESTLHVAMSTSFPKVQSFISASPKLGSLPDKLSKSRSLESQDLLFVQSKPLRPSYPKSRPQPLIPYSHFHQTNGSHTRIFSNSSSSSPHLEVLTPITLGVTALGVEEPLQPPTQGRQRTTSNYKDFGSPMPSNFTFDLTPHNGGLSPNFWQRSFRNTPCSAPVIKRQTPINTFLLA